ncbi:IMPACT family protein [Methylobacter sp. sgz302048]|uniref:IMPACT family protein n=1 Tax=Methylobacter sp. sgz302048 TaxID=3455945 RepID=UPI003FA18394
MHCVKSKLTIEDTIKKSRFIGMIVPCISESEALLNLKQLYAEHPNANHIAFAYRIRTDHGFVSRFHDAGEPTGTAGKPIFQHIEGKQLINLLIAVIRYFGGVKLGAGGLTRAYGNTAKSVIEAADIHPFVELASVRLTLDYNQMQPLEYQLKKLDGQIVEQDFAEQIKLLIQLPADNVDLLLQSFPGNA